MTDFYLGNQNLPRENYKHAFTQEEIDEFLKCSQDPVYFSKKYVKIINVDEGLVPFNMWDFQEDMLRTFHENRFSICKLPRQVGKTTVSVSYLLHFILFNENVNVAILANKAGTAREILGKLQLSYENLPRFLQQGVVEWNKGSIELANGSRILAESTSGSSVRGRAFNIIFLDEFAFVPNGIAEAFFTSTYPTISSGKTTKVIMVSTPNGMNHFYRFWQDAIEGRSLYKPIEIHWSMVPGRDEAWREETIRNTSEEQFRQEFETEFIGSTNTLINPVKLRSLAFRSPSYQEDYYHEYFKPEENKTYVIVVDVARGQGLDYSAFSVIDVSQIPYVQVAKYRCNTIPPMIFPSVIINIAKKYNDAFVLVEVNDIGQQVADIIHFELAYENLLKIQVKGRAGQQVTSGFTKKLQLGVRTSVQVKKIGCVNLKTLIENDKLLINDADTIMELTTFSADNQSFAAEEGNHDDLVMTLVLFGWLASQTFFKESVRNDIRKVLQQEQLQIVDEDLMPFGIINDGLNNFDKDKDGDVWFETDNNFGLTNNWEWDNKL